MNSNNQETISTSKRHVQNNMPLKSSLTKQKTTMSYILKKYNIDTNFYKHSYPDLATMRHHELVEHYIRAGINEGRIVSNKHAQILTGNHQFNVNNYKSRYPRLQNSLPEEIIQHYILTTRPRKTCIIYVYYERKNEQKNQTNLAYFLNHGLNKSKWRNENITVLFMINNKQCEVLFPKMFNTHILPCENDVDTSSYAKGIKYMEEIYKKPFYECFTHLCIMNCGVIGPIYEDGPERHWLDPFFYKLHTENSVICTPCINFLREDDAGGPGPRCQSYFSLIKITKHVYNLLLHTPIRNVEPRSTNTSVVVKHDVIFGPKATKEDAILIGEYGMTRILIDNDYNISCLIYHNVDYNKSPLYAYNHSDRIDRLPGLTKEFFRRMIFVKNYWRINEKLRDSLPCYYTESIKYMSEKCKFKCIYDDVTDAKYDHSTIDIANQGSVHNSGIYTWSNKREFYDIFGYAEEHIIWPIKKPNNDSCVIYCHYDKDNIIKDYVIHALKTMMLLNYDIIFYTTSGAIRNVDLPFRVNYFENKGAGSDFDVMLHVFTTRDLYTYKWICLLNDSIMLPIHGIPNMNNTITKMRRDNDFWGLYESNEFVIHVCSNCYFEISNKCILPLIEFFREGLKTCKTKQQYIENLELKQTSYLVSKGFKYSAVVSYKTLQPHHHSILFNPINTESYLSDPACFGIKWKYLANYTDFEKTNNHYLNYLFRYLKTARGQIPGLPKYFEYMFGRPQND